MERIENKIFDEERALYGIGNAEIVGCSFSGKADGESALKEASGLKISDCEFLLRYPLWHVKTAELKNCTMSETCRAALWYDSDITLENCNMGGIKALRECDKTSLKNCTVVSPEFGWFCREVKIDGGSLSAEYAFLRCRDLCVNGIHMQGKYSFQYLENAVFENCVLDTKDAFWHSKNVTVKNSVIKGEYLAWYSQNLHLINCEISGTQPLCYAEGLVLENCTMTGCDLSFEKSEVNATISGGIDSVKNPSGGSISADEIGEIILEEAYRGKAKISVRG